MLQYIFIIETILQRLFSIQDADYHMCGRRFVKIANVGPSSHGFEAVVAFLSSGEKTTFSRCWQVLWRVLKRRLRLRRTNNLPYSRKCFHYFAVFGMESILSQERDEFTRTGNRQLWHIHAEVLNRKSGRLSVKRGRQSLRSFQYPDTTPSSLD